MSEELFKSKPFAEIIDNKSNSEPLFQLWGNYWYQHEICILFADSNQGKSILAVDISIAIAAGKNFYCKQMSDVQEGVLYFDFELSDKQFCHRYSNGTMKYTNNLIRIGLNSAAINIKIDEDDILDEIKSQIRMHNTSKVLIIDNITFLCDSLVNSKSAIKLMKGLKTLKEKYGLSILVLAHTPKRNQSKPITQNDLQGSKNLMNFCDSAIAIGSSTEGKEIKYLKHIKARSVKLEEEVVVLEISDNPYLHFNYLRMSEEDEHLTKKKTMSKITPELEEKILEMNEDGYSIREIANELGIGKSSVGRFLNR